MMAFATSSTLGLTGLKSIHQQGFVTRVRRGWGGVRSRAPARMVPNCVASGIREGHGNKILLDGFEVSYSYFSGDKSLPTVIFLPGFFYSRWRQAKANALEIFAKRKGQSILVGEYVGIGSSGGDFGRDGTLSRWIKDTCSLIDEVVGDGRVILVGAGVGGWLMLHVALERPDAVVGLVGVNASVDFTHDLILPAMTEAQKEELETKNSIDMQWGYRTYPIGKALINDAEKWLALRGGPNSLNITCPVRLIQGLSDEEIPPERAIKLVDTLKSDNVTLAFIKNGDHILEEETDLKRMWEAVCDVTDQYYEYDLTSPGSG